jgi:predicted phosphodiesterase
MTRVWILSDLHLEFDYENFLPLEAPDCDVVVMAGDIAGSCLASVRYIASQPALASLPVVLVPGNHEFYGSVLQDNLAEGLAAATEANRFRSYPIHLLAPGTVIAAGARFVGAALWTDYRLMGTPKRSMVKAGQELNDHRLIRFRETDGHLARLMPWHAAAEHRRDLAHIVKALGEPHDGQTVVVTHHLPSARSIPVRFQGSDLNPAFASDLEWLIERAKPALWIHGHTHDASDYSIGATRIICNPHGYARGTIILGPDRLRINGYRADLIVEV